MRAFGALNGLRVGCVQYLNAKPLIVPYDGPVAYEHPARLADMLAAGELDVALVPVYEALRQPEYPVADGVAISSRGAVYSVVLAYAGRLEEIQAVTLDAASRTSNNLLRCMLAEYHGLRPTFDGQGGVGPGRGLLLIGNQAIRFREEKRPGVKYLDLGAEWLARTGLPFVYAVWQMRPEVGDAAGVAGALRAVKEAGGRRLREIARLQRDFDEGFAQRYLTEFIKFDLGEEEKAGLVRFRELLEGRGLLDAGRGGLRFV